MPGRSGEFIRRRSLMMMLLAALCVGPAACGRTSAQVGSRAIGWTGSAADPLASFPDSAAGARGRPTAVALFAGRDDVLYLAWTTSRGDSSDLWLTRSADLGEHFDPPMRVNDEPGTVVVRRDASIGPECAIGPHDEIDAVWTDARGGGASGTGVYFARSSDGGASFAPAVRVDDGPDSTAQSFAALSTDERARPWIAWLGAGTEQEEPRRVRVTFSLDGGRSFLPSLAAAPLTAPAAPARCKPAIAARGASVLVVFRADSDSARGVFLALSSDGGASFAAPHPLGGVGKGTPDDAPALALLPEDRFAAAWVSEERGTPAVRFLTAGVEDTAYVTTTPAPPDDGVSQAHPVLYARERFLALAWEERAGGAEHPVFCFSWDGGNTFSPPETLGPPGEPAGAAPRFTLAGVRHLIAGWSLTGPAGSLRLARTVLEEVVTEKGGT